MNKLCWVAVGLLLLAGCRGAKVKTGGSTTASPAEVFQVRSFPFEYLTTRAKVSYEGGEQRFGATVNIRMERDRQLWFSVSPALGIEVMRGLARPDSVFVIDRLNKKSYALDYAALSRRVNFQVTFSLLQAIVVGDLPFPDLQRVQLLQREGQYVLEQRADSLFMFNYVDEVDRRLRRVQASQLGSNGQLTLDYSAFEPVADVPFPYTTDVRVAAGARASTTTVQLRHTRLRVEADSPGFPFDAPDHYQKVTQ